MRPFSSKGLLNLTEVSTASLYSYSSISNQANSDKCNYVYKYLMIHGANTLLLIISITIQYTCKKIFFNKNVKIVKEFA